MKNITKFLNNDKFEKEEEEQVVWRLFHLHMLVRSSLWVATGRHGSKKILLSSINTNFLACHAVVVFIFYFFLHIFKKYNIYKILGKK